MCFLFVKLTIIYFIFPKIKVPIVTFKFINKPYLINKYLPWNENKKTIHKLSVRENAENNISFTFVFGQSVPVGSKTLAQAAFFVVLLCVCFWNDKGMCRGVI